MGFSEVPNDDLGPNGGTAPPSLPWLDMSSWDDGDPLPLDWSITNLVPCEQVGLFSGVGGTGKTTTELLKDAAHVIGLPWLNWMPTQGPAQVYGLVSHVQALALASGGSVTLLTHPSLQGIRSGSGYSGSTAWHDAFRFRQYLRAAQDDDDEPVDPANDNGLRELTFMKNQYGAPVAKLALRHQRGLFLPESGGGAINLEKIAEEAKVDAAFLDLLDRFTAQGRNAGAAPNSPNYAPTMFAKEGCGCNRKQLDAAMRRLFNASKIRVESYRQGGHTRQRIAPK